MCSSPEEGKKLGRISHRYVALLDCMASLVLGLFPSVRLRFGTANLQYGVPRHTYR